MLNLLLAANLLLVSDRDMFCDAEKISHKTEVIWDHSSAKAALEEIKGKKVLVLVHGFNNPEEKVLTTYRTINEHVSSLQDEGGNSFYDVVIGYLWPSYDDGLEYYYAKKNVRKLASRMRSHLVLFDMYASHVDIMAHSMGNYLVFEALDFATMQQHKPVRMLYSIAAAVDNESIEKGEIYYNSTQNCEKMFVFHSKDDEVLQYLYTASEFDLALGYDGPEDKKNVPSNVQLVDSSSFAHSHSAYFTAKAMYDFIHKQLLKINEIHQK